MKKYLVLLYTVFAFTTAIAQSPKWVDVQSERQITRYESREQIENKLLSEARLQAIQKGTGITIRSVESMTTLERSTADSQNSDRASKWFEEYLQYSRQETAGRIVNEDRPKYTAFDRNGEMWLRIEFRALVALDKGDIDPGFSAVMRTRQPAYRDGDTIRVELESTKNSKLYLFNVSAEGKCTLVWPNQVETDNNISARVKTIIPKNTSRYAMVAEFPSDSDKNEEGTEIYHSQELLFAILYRGNESVFDPATAFVQEYTLSEVNQRLISIPRAQRFEVMAAFSITK